MTTADAALIEINRVLTSLPLLPALGQIQEILSKALPTEQAINKSSTVTTNAISLSAAATEPISIEAQKRARAAEMQRKRRAAKREAKN